jgi:hypothetical protein
MPQKIFKQSYFDFLTRSIKRKDKSVIDKICNSSPFDDDSSYIESSYPSASDIYLISKSEENYLLQNSIAIHQGLKLTRYQASDLRLWSYLALVVFRNYMESTRPINPPDNSSKLGEKYSDKFNDYILRHYLFDGSSVGDLLLNDISLLWWVAELTITDDEADPYKLTAEAHTMQDYTRHLLPGVQGRDRAFRHAVLEYVSENKSLFENYKEGKVRLIQRKLNLEAGIKLFPCMAKDEIKQMIDRFRAEIITFKP